MVGGGPWSDFDLAEMDPYAVTPAERVLIDREIRIGVAASDAQIEVFVAQGAPEEVVVAAGRDRLLAKRLIAVIVERQVDLPLDVMVALRAIVTWPSST